jgi:hypothetical protein
MDREPGRSPARVLVGADETVWVLDGVWVGEDEAVFEGEYVLVDVNPRVEVKGGVCDCVFSCILCGGSAAEFSGELPGLQDTRANTIMKINGIICGLVSMGILRINEFQ